MTAERVNEAPTPGVSGTVNLAEGGAEPEVQVVVWLGGAAPVDEATEKMTLADVSPKAWVGVRPELAGTRSWASTTAVVMFGVVTVGWIVNPDGFGSV
jgi:hypothetical protein